jgi:hypothetical protein
MSGNNYTQNKYLIWNCKCGKTYALEINTLKTHKCKVEIRRGIPCGVSFPNQEQRKEMYQKQFGIIIPS